MARQARRDVIGGSGAPARRSWGFSALLLIPTPLQAEGAEAVEVTAVRKRLNVEDWSQDRVGALTWRGGLELTSPAANFGGLSGLLVSADGAQLTAVTDQGHWLMGQLTYDSEGNLSGLENTFLGKLLDEEGTPLAGKEQQDAESLARLANGDLLVSFERDHRLWRYATDGTGEVSFASRSFEIPVPNALARLSANKGLEALVTLESGEIVALTEGRSATGTHPVFLRKDDAWHQLDYQGVEDHRPTGRPGYLTATSCCWSGVSPHWAGFPSGWGLSPGPRLNRAPRCKAAKLPGFCRPLTIDNFEGVATWQGPRGETLIALLADDNFSPLQRTLLLVFELED